MDCWHWVDVNGVAKECPQGWTQVSLRSAAILRLIDFEVPDCITEPSDILNFSTRYPRHDIRDLLGAFLEKHRHHSPHDIDIYLGRAIVCADFFFESASDATLFKLSHA